MRRDRILLTGSHCNKISKDKTKQRRRRHSNRSNIYRNICKFVDCETMASFGLRKRTHCVKHRSIGMINLTSKKCETYRCINRAIFGFVKNTL